MMSEDGPSFMKRSQFLFRPQRLEATWLQL
ncbi:unnamed protein product [Heligmosomoides polygyrus]|uniref:Uncharacterized protein n=1 Tax=Heligmosomoides polygyrus TaxID=6339 RepID=A0A3P8DHQ2_HELPZ|nr:unnamed protein product [Heligmosomoides polygyrus]